MKLSKKELELLQDFLSFTSSIKGENDFKGLYDKVVKELSNVDPLEKLYYKKFDSEWYLEYTKINKHLVFDKKTKKFIRAKYEVNDLLDHDDIVAIHSILEMLGWLK